MAIEKLVKNYPKTPLFGSFGGIFYHILFMGTYVGGSLVNDCDITNLLHNISNIFLHKICLCPVTIA